VTILINLRSLDLAQGASQEDSEDCEKISVFKQARSGLHASARARGLRVRGSSGPGGA